uniref:Uncharacterized protein n=1 Tax=Anguilla anguilla TaxID=7936 RepID=A0A0E9WHS8_ANGAN
MGSFILRYKWKNSWLDSSVPQCSYVCLRLLPQPNFQRIRIDINGHVTVT